MSDYDHWLSAHRTWTQNVWCSNPECDTFRDRQTVRIESEYGQSAADPEVCPVCGARWLDDPPEEDDEG